MRRAGSAPSLVILHLFPLHPSSLYLQLFAHLPLFCSSLQLCPKFWASSILSQGSNSTPLTVYPESVTHIMALVYIKELWRGEKGNSIGIFSVHSLMQYTTPPNGAGGLVQAEEAQVTESSH